MLLVMDLGFAQCCVCCNTANSARRGCVAKLVGLLCTLFQHTSHDICDCSLCLLQELSGVTQLQAVKDSYVPVIKFQVICLDAGSPAFLKL